MFLGGKSDLYLRHWEKEKHCLTRDAIQQSGCKVIKPLLGAG